MNERRMRLWIGLFVAGALVLLGTLIVLFRSFPRYLRPGTPYTIVFSDAPGVEPGTPVRRSGVRIGEVTRVELDDKTGEVRVGVRIDSQFTIRTNDEPVLMTGLFGSDVTIDFVPRAKELTPVPPPNGNGKAPKDRPDGQGEEAQQPPEGPPPPANPPVPPGTVLRGRRPAGVGTMVDRAAEVLPTTQQTMNDIRRSLQRLDERMDRLTPIAEETLREYRDLARDVRDSVPDLRRTNEEVRGLTRDLRAAVPDLRRTNDDVAATARAWNRLGERLEVLVQTNQDKVVKTIDNLNDSLTRVNNLLSEENQRAVNRTLHNLGSASDRFDGIARNAEDITKEGRTTVRRLNDTLVRADATLADVQKITKPLGERGTALARNIDEGVATLNRTLTDLDALVRAIGNSNGTVSRLLTDPTLYNRLDETICAAQKALPRLDRILANVEVFADKLARHPELLGVRGAVRPDSGLK